VKERLFGQILRVDQVQPEGREPLALELESFVAAVRTRARSNLPPNRTTPRCDTSPIGRSRNWKR